MAVVGKVKLPNFVLEGMEASQLRWKDAACRDHEPDMFFVDEEESKARITKEAIKVCQGCDIRNECLEYALSNRIRHGVWGAMTGYQRTKLLNEQKKRVA